MNVTWKPPPSMEVGQVHQLVFSLCEEVAKVAATEGILANQTMIAGDEYIGWSSYELMELVPNPVRILFWTVPFHGEQQLMRCLFFLPRSTRIFSCLDIFVTINDRRLGPICERVAAKLFADAPIQLTACLSYS